VIDTKVRELIPCLLDDRTPVDRPERRESGAGIRARIMP
jgi:hypothetical protein